MLGEASELVSKLWGSSRKKPVTRTGFTGERLLRLLANQAADSQYPELNGLLMRSAMGEMSRSLSVGIFSPNSVVNSIPVTLLAPGASFARSAWPVGAERATEKNRSI